MYVSVGVMKDYKLKLRKLRASDTLENVAPPVGQHFTIG